MKIAISIPDDLSRTADEAARRLRIPRSQLYGRALCAYLQQEGHADITERLNAVYGKLRARQDRADADRVFLDQGKRALRRSEWKE